MSTRSFSSLLAQLNKAQAEAVKSMGFASFLKVDLKHILETFSKWLVESFDPYAILPDRQKFLVTTFHVCATLGVPLRGTKIIEITKSSTDEEYDKVYAVWLKEWKLQKNAPKLTRMWEFILAEKEGGESFKRNIIIYLVDCFFCRPKNHYYSKLILKYVNPTLPLHKLDGEAKISRDTLVLNASIIVEKEDHCKDVSRVGTDSAGQPKSSPSDHLYLIQALLGLMKIMVVKMTVTVTCKLSIKKPAEKNPKEGDELSSRKVEPVEQKKGSPRASGKQEATNSMPKLTEKVSPEEHDETRSGAARTPEKLEEVGSSNALKT
ncbi:LOW QUALITY PROTEIN: hypothetical protein Cgig2_002552 [Carnegiea gigantea]|uniref:Uncharacterized protein n=1 Tax=Carnegiea gigantea TaxID=171969 RepID=A0A9Q1JKM9_9CARY|nr:LOW QUALITY PROTEIN: hypothetical protein Cgig2_002552 [Carnegiea gigantea]